jgi:transposase-like protein
MALEHAAEHDSHWATMLIAAESGRTAKTLRGWMRKAERDQGMRPGATTNEPERIRAPGVPLLGRSAVHRTEQHRPFQIDGRA